MITGAIRARHQLLFTNDQAVSHKLGNKAQWNFWDVILTLTN